MLAYLEKFNQLPAATRSKVSDSRAMAIIEDLEKKYQVTLAALIMKVVVGEISLNDLTANLVKENLAKERAELLARELKEKIFLNFGDKMPPAEAKVVNEAPAADIKVKGASFFFSPEDESEIRELAKKIEEGEKILLSAEAIEIKLGEITDRAQINFGSVELSERFKQILKTYLRGIRNRLETRVALVKPFANGGLSFDEDSADKVMSLADKVLNGKKVESMKPLAKIRIPEMEEAAAAVKPARVEIARDAVYDFSKLKKTLGDARDRQTETIKNDLKKLDTGHELSAPASAKAPTSKPVSAALKPAAPEIAPLAAQMPLIKRRFEAENLSQSPRAKLQDVKYVPKVMGPLDEIKYLDLTGFRRLDRDPARIIDKIKSKIDLLAEEDYAKKLEGIRFWRSSPVNRQYLEIGHLSISSGKPIDVIIEEKKARGEESLTAQEFEAIMDLNKSLRF